MNIDLSKLGSNKAALPTLREYKAPAKATVARPFSTREAAVLTKQFVKPIKEFKGKLGSAELNEVNSLARSFNSQRRMKPSLADVIDFRIHAIKAATEVSLSHTLFKDLEKMGISQQNIKDFIKSRGVGRVGTDEGTQTRDGSARHDGDAGPDTSVDSGIDAFNSMYAVDSGTVLPSAPPAIVSSSAMAPALSFLSPTAREAYAAEAGEIGDELNEGPIEAPLGPVVGRGPEGRVAGSEEAIPSDDGRAHQEEDAAGVLQAHLTSFMRDQGADKMFDLFTQNFGLYILPGATPVDVFDICLAYFAHASQLLPERLVDLISVEPVPERTMNFIRETFKEPIVNFYGTIDSAQAIQLIKEQLMEKGVEVAKGKHPSVLQMFAASVYANQDEWPSAPDDLKAYFSVGSVPAHREAPRAPYKDRLKRIVAGENEEDIAAAYAPLGDRGRDERVQADYERMLNDPEKYTVKKMVKILKEEYNKRPFNAEKTPDFRIREYLAMLRMGAAVPNEIAKLFRNLSTAEQALLANKKASKR